jgi:hypothetical protein
MRKRHLRHVVPALVLAILAALATPAPALAAPAAVGPAYPFRDPDRRLDARVDDLLGRLTLDEKISMLHQYQPAIPRLGIGLFKAGTVAADGTVGTGSKAQAARFTREVLTSGTASAASAAAGADATVVVVGSNPFVYGRENHDRASTALGASQQALVEAVRRANPNTVVVLESSYPTTTGSSSATRRSARGPAGSPRGWPMRAPARAPSRSGWTRRPGRWSARPASRVQQTCTPTRR